MSDKPKVIFEKPQLPTLWLDTSVIIKLTKVERGERLEQVEVDRLTRLRTLVQELVPAGKLIFPQSDQEEEYVAKRLDPEIHRDFLGLSLLTGNAVIQSGDIMDVGLLSVAIPACHFVVTDKRQCDRIKRRGIDKEWGTEVYSMSDADGLFERLEKLR